MTHQDRSKQLAVYCLDGCILFAYRGIADAPGQVDTVEWLASVAACGHPETVDEFLTRLLAQLNSAFATGRMYFRELLIVTGTAFVQTGKVHTFVLSNRRTDSSGRLISLKNFAFLPCDRSRDCFIGASGDAAGHVPQSERQRISEIITHIPRRRREYLKLLATTIERISSRNARVSPWAQTVFMPRLGYPLLGETLSRLASEMRARSAKYQ